ncbi:hypothetical protein DO97_07715 [Neosynechococcus sphagnicola sy1]|uniref:Uncharacterized protein n=1 Tax=Neosynechococcus sphagnicola sy1 TaxID=1497020 RepID=A0A098TJS0_9CYAN|nr:hypothetical protein DO97_07715 [Neosynechococcus sphagnicola sy1]
MRGDTIHSLNHSTVPSPGLPRPTWELERLELLEQLDEVRSLAQNRLDRIHQLEQALDQCLMAFWEIKLLIRDQESMESQLAATEAFSHVQQQAIMNLNQQLSQQQQELALQEQVFREREQQFQELLSAAEVMAQAQQTELGYLRSHLVHDRTTAQVYQNQLIQDLQTALASQQQRGLELAAQVLTARTQIISLEVQLDETQRQLTTYQQQHACMEQRAPLSHGGVPPYDLSTSKAPDPALLQLKLAGLETELVRQRMLQAKLQHTCQELTAERDRHSDRTVALTQQVAEMQEQILQQAQQAKEYEAAVQHWKDRFLVSHRYALRCQDLLAQTLTDPAVIADSLTPTDPACDLLPPMDPDVLIPDFLMEIQPTALPESSEPMLLESFLSPVGDLPAFLARRRRNYRVQ